jgi:PAS domain S-box-containing protein
VSSTHGDGGPGQRRERVDRARLRLLEQAASSTLGELLTATLDLAEELTGSRIGFFHFVENDQSTLWLQAWSTHTIARMCTAGGTGSHYPLPQAGVWADCVRLGKPVVHNDYASLPARKGMPPGHAQVIRELTVPVIRDGRICAVLGVGNKPADYDDQDIVDVSALADLAWDIAARKRAEEALARSEAKFRGLFDTMMDGLVVVDMEGHVLESNETYRGMLGFTAEELATRTYPELTPEGWHAAEARIVAEQVLPRGYSDVYEKEYRRKDGSTFPVELRTFLLREGDRPSAMWAIVRDVTDRKQSEIATRYLLEQVQAEKDLLAALLESIGDEVWFADPQGRFTLANRAALAQFRMAAAKDRSVEEMARSLEVLRADGTPRPLEETPPLRALRGEEVRGQEEIVRTPATGELRHRQVTATPVRDRSGRILGSVSVVRDVTELRALQAHLALASRLAAMGTLVAGVAHEINNPLAAEIADQGIALEIAREIQGRLQGTAPIDRAAEARALGDAIEALEEAQEGGQRIARIVKNLSTFGRPDTRRTRIRLAEVVAEAMRWLPATVARAATVQVEDGGGPEVVASVGQIEQVVVNLVTNAVRAIPAGRRGLVRVRLGPGEPGTSRMEVVDDGKGIEPVLLDRIFEPFFTTRPAGEGRGMGLGLAICHAIVTSHGGTLTASSAVGRGSTFRVDLPVAPDPLPPAQEQGLHRT